MHVSLLIWSVTLAALVLLLAADLVVISRRPHEPSLREAALWVSFSVAVAVVFGALVLAGYGPRYGAEFFAGWITEYSLSVDNLFVFVVIMARLRTPRAYQQKALLIGIVLALVMRGAFIVLGAATLSRFAWIFYFFGIFLIYTAVNLVRHGEADPAEVKENAAIGWARRFLPVSRDHHGGRMTVRDRGRWMFTPMVIVVVALGTTDLLFALDSIPAIFGLTREAYLVFTANVFALMGLRQLYFMLGGLLDRLVHLPVGLAAVLGFIGVKLVLEALRGNDLPFVNGGAPVAWAPHVPIWLSLAIIVGTLLLATVASLVTSRRDRTATGPARAGAQGGATPSGAPGTAPDGTGRPVPRAGVRRTDAGQPINGVAPAAPAPAAEPLPPARPLPPVEPLPPPGPVPPVEPDRDRLRRPVPAPTVPARRSRGTGRGAG